LGVSWLILLYFAVSTALNETWQDGVDMVYR